MDEITEDRDDSEAALVVRKRIESGEEETFSVESVAKEFGVKLPKK